MAGRWSVYRVRIGGAAMAASLSVAMGAVGITATPVEAAPHALLVVDANTGTVLIDQAGSEPRSPASLTKMMTLYMTFEALERGSITLKTRVRMSERAADAPPSKLNLDAGDTITVEDAIKALVTKSANDVAIALAEHFSGSEDAFARAMTARARELDMNGTTFKNASGLPDPGQMTTARDMVTLALRLYDSYPRYFQVFTTRAFAYGGKTYKNHNTLMIQMPGINGIKTGYTNASGFNLVTSYEKDGRHLMAAIFGGESAASRNAAMRIALMRSIPKGSTAKTRRPLIVASARPSITPPAPQPAPRRPGAVARAQIAAAGPVMVPAPVAVRPPAAVARPASQMAPVEVAPVLMAPVLGPNVQMAKVRTVDAAIDAMPLSQSQSQSAHDPLPSDAKVAVRRPPLAPPVSVAAPLPAAPLPATLAVIARPPSSLNQQHLSLASAAGASQSSGDNTAPLAPSYRLNGPSMPIAAVTSAGTGGYDIQIGALATAEDADRLLAQAQAKSGSVLAGRAPVRKPALVNGRTFQRARFTGFDQISAANACAELARRQFSCLVMKAE